LLLRFFLTRTPEKDFKIAKFIVTFYKVGDIRYAPGTFGSLMGFPVFFVINLFVFKFNIDNLFLVFLFYLFVIALLYLVAYLAITHYTKITKKEDPREVVIDEVIGQLIAYMLSTIFFPYYRISHQSLFEIIVVFFPIIFFRFFDIKKPSYVGYFDRELKNAHGVILDDVVAGAFAGGCVIVILLVLSLF
jgi:phosphatidylglycerophosphatase A